MTETKKVTKREVITSMLKNEVIINNPVFKAYLENELELLNKKSSSKTSSKNAKENAEVKEILLAELGKIGKPTTITDLITSSEVVKNYVLENGKPLTNQKISALFKIMIEVDKTIVKTSDKKKSYFSVA